MAERDDIEAVGHRYRGLPREEPSSALDAEILARARRAMVDHPAPLVAPAGRRGWAYPLAAAAIIVLAIGVTVQLQRGESDSELSVAPAPAAVQGYAAKEEAAPAQPARHADAPAEKPKVATELSKQAAPAREAAPPAPAVRDEARALAGSAAANAVEPPEPWLERIAKLRDEGRDDEADRQLAEFRRRYPDYRIAVETLRKVERRAR